MLQTGTLAVLTLTGHITVPILTGLCLIQGLIYSFDDPARQMLLIGLAGDRALLDNVIALNSITINLTRLAGPALSGLIIAGMGPGVCYSIDACAYLPVLVALTAVRIAPAPGRRPESHPLIDLREGLAYAWDHAPIRRVLLLVPVISLVGFTHTLLGPVFARDVFGGDARTLGFLMSTSGVGSLLGGAFLSTRRGGFTFPRAIAWGPFIGSVAYFGIAVSPSLPWGLLCYAAAGLGATMFLVSTNTWLQQVVADDKRGRTLSLYGMGQGFYPVGSLLLGAFAAGIGPRVTIAFCGLVLFASGTWFVRAFFGSARKLPAGVHAGEPRASP
jgi:MFS family permease